MPTAAGTRRTKIAVEARRWWAWAAYSGRDVPAALAALEASGIPLKTVAGSHEFLSEMARGDALIKGAARLAFSRRKGQAQATRHHRLLQWRLVMGYAGFEIFAKACLRKPDTVGLRLDDFKRLLAECSLPRILIDSPVLDTKTSRWLSALGAGDPIDKLGSFLKLRPENQKFLHAWFRGNAIESHAEALELAKILRHATAHGVLSPTKCRGLGLLNAVTALPLAMEEVRIGVISRLHGCRK